MGRGKTAKTLALIDACHAILADIQPATVRAVAYQLFIRGYLESMAKTCTNRVSTQLVYAREQGIVPWRWIVDETREAERPGTWDNPETFIPAVMASYRRDRWMLQSHRVEVWSEKGTVRGTLAPILRDYGITFRVMHGYASATTIYDVAQESLADTRPLIVCYVGDWDPSGLHMSSVDIPTRLQEYGAEALYLDRVAITQSDSLARTLPGFSAETKKGDARYQWFTSSYGLDCFELDALSPALLRTRVENMIRGFIDWDAWERCATTEYAEQRSLEGILGTWRSCDLSDRCATIVT